MGNCCTAPANTSFFKRTHNRRCLSSISSDYGDVIVEVCAAAPEVTVQPLFSILKGPVLAAGEGDLLRRYRLGAELGRGEFGVTRLCEDLETGETLACKTISKRKLRTLVDVDDVRQEVAIMRSLPPHPNIVGMRNAYEDAEAVHIVMEVCEGGEFFDRIVARAHYGERLTFLFLIEK